VLTLTFHDEGTRRSQTVSSPSFRFAGDCLENGRGDFVARYVGHGWLLNDELFHSVECKQPVQCRFEGGDASVEGGDASEQQGPLRPLEVQDATLSGAGKPLARLSEQESMWLSAESSNRYSRISIIEAPSSPRTSR